MYILASLTVLNFKSFEHIELQQFIIFGSKYGAFTKRENFSSKIIKIILMYLNALLI